jgi:hypothetical protein
MQELHVIAAGSLLEFALQKIPSFAVGRVRSKRVPATRLARMKSEGIHIGRPLGAKLKEIKLTGKEEMFYGLPFLRQEQHARHLNRIFS